MTPADKNKFLAASQRWYERLIAIYPRDHRIEYGPAMALLFRDQSRDAWRDARGRGLLLLWLRILPDLLKTSLLEHFANLKGKKLMLNKIFSSIRAPSAARNAFIIVFVFAFCTVFMTSVVVTFLLPEVYSSKARIKIERDVKDAAGAGDTRNAGGVYDPYFIQTEFEVIQSEVVLDKVVDQLNLNDVWAKKFNLEGKFKTSESRQVLKRMIELHTSPARNLVDITVFSEDRSEAARVANSVAKNYQTYRQNTRNLQMSQANHEVLLERATSGKKITTENEETSIKEIITQVNQLSSGSAPDVEIIETAEPSFRPVRPNKPLNIFLGGITAGLIGLLTGGLAACIVSRMQRRGVQSPPPLQTIQTKY